MKRLLGTLENRGANYLIALLLCLYVNGSFTTQKTPPGTMYLKSQSLFVDKTEIRNIEWAEYLWHVREYIGMNTDEYRAILPDTNIWKSVYPNGHLGSVSSRFPETYMPMVGITHEQALAYCEWRSDRVYESTKMRIKYRLPTAQEWEAIAKETLNAKQFLYDKNLKSTESKKLVNLQDNVAEFVAEPGIIKGLDAGYLSTHKNVKYEDVFIDRKINEAMPYVGFRCVAERVKE